MKTMSPSAVIFGPMIAIFSEAVLLDITVRLFGKTLFGYILGGMLAMSWNLFHKIMNYILFYGLNIIEIYTNLLKYAQKQLDIHFEIVWLPILVLLLIYCVLGFLSAIIGIKVGRKIVKQPADYKLFNVATTHSEKLNKTKPEFNYSMVWLFINIVAIIGSLILLNYSFIFGASSIVAIVTIWAFRYKRALRQLSKPKFWLFFVFITMITAFVFTKLQAKSLEHALLIGIQMNLRAVIIIVGFSVLGTELYNPKIREFFLKTYFKQLPLALELSFASLPSMIANIPDFKTIIKNPVSVIYQIISQAEFRLNEIKNNFSQKIFIVSGAIGQGKTTQLQKIIEACKAKNISVGGIYSPRIVENETTIGYDIVDIMNNTRAEFLRKTEDKSLTKIGRYTILPAGLQIGINALMPSKNSNNKVVIIDEIGLLELDNQGWANNLNDLLKASNSHLILAVRDSFTEQVIQKWKFKEYTLYNISNKDYLEISDLITEKII
ncbi:MAG: nucleoside-triphosphatase [Salinivirgaceae bacterium]